MEAITIAENEAFLRQKSAKVNFPDKNLEQDVEIVKEYCRTHNGCFAMASIQLGIPKRIVVIKSTSSDCSPNPEKDWLVLINPEIISQCGKTEFWEACFSGMLNFGLVERPYAMRIKYQDMRGGDFITNFEGFVCTVLSHELDHLEGIFHMDRAKKLIQIPKEERVIYRAKAPYKIYSKTCKFTYPKLNQENS